MVSKQMHRQETVAVFQSQTGSRGDDLERRSYQQSFFIFRTLMNKKGDISSVNRLKAKILQIIFLLLQLNKLAMSFMEQLFCFNDCLAVFAIHAT